jgi:tol-pal system protein YbgF
MNDPGNSIGASSWFTASSKVVVIRFAPAVALSIAVVALATAALAADPATEQRLSNIDARLTRLEGVLDNKVLLEMLQRIESLQRELQAVRDATDLTGHELEGIKDRQRELYLEVDRRLRALETAKTQAPAGVTRAPDAAAHAPDKAASTPSKRADEKASRIAARPDTPPLDGTPPSDATAIDGDELGSQAYQDAFELLKAGRNEAAIAAFRQFIEDYPQSEYAANAQYWLAEANYVAGDFSRAAEEFAKVIERYPISSKVPDAKLKLGFTHYELEQWDQARSVLSELSMQYPNTSVAQLAENRLQRMDREGH